MSTTTTTCAEGLPSTSEPMMTIDKLAKAVSDLEQRVGKTNEWVLTSPSGLVWTGTVEQLVMVLAVNHSTYRQLFNAPDPAEPTKFVNVGSILY